MAPPANRRGNRGGGGNQGGQQGVQPEDSAREIFDAAIAGALSKALGRQIGSMLPKLAMDQLYALLGQKQLGMATRFLGEAIALTMGDDIPRRAVIDGMSGLAEALESVDLTQSKASLKAQIEGIVRGNAKFQELAGHTPEFFQKSHLVPFSEALTGLTSKDVEVIVDLVSVYSADYLSIQFTVRELEGIAKQVSRLAAKENPPGTITAVIANKFAKRFAPKPVVPQVDEYIALVEKLRKQFEDHEKRPDTVPLPQRLRAGTHASAVARQGVENGVQRVAAAHPKTELRRFFDNFKKLLP